MKEMSNIDLELLKKLEEQLTKDYTDVPLFYVTIDLKEVQRKKDLDDALTYTIHPDLENDKELSKLLKEMVEHLKSHYDLNKILRQ